MPSYLDQLPEHLRYQGSHTDKEIELRHATDDSAAVIYSDKYIMLILDPVVFPSGSPGTYLRVIETPVLKGASGTVIIPIADQHVVFIEIFRHATRSWEWELPRGFQESGLTASENATKEIEEELSVRPVDTECLGPIAPNTGLLAGIAEALIATLPSGSLDQVQGEANESIRTVKGVPLHELDEFILMNVRCGFSLSALLLAKLRKKL
jgi:ADP-ribose pyrophosphatase